VKIDKFEWSQALVDKIIQKHKVFPEEAEEIFQGKSLRVRKYGDIYHALGRTATGRYLFVVYRKTAKSSLKIITARDVTSSEKKLYGR